MTEVDPLARAQMVAYCGWDPTEVVTDSTVHIDGKGSRMLALPSMFVRDVSAVVVTPRDELEPVTLTVGPVGEVGWSADGCILCRSAVLGQRFPVGERNVSVTYSGGYTETPADLQAALDSLSKRMAKMPIRSERMGDVSFSYASPGDLLLVERMVLDRYRIVRVA